MLSILDPCTVIRVQSWQAGKAPPSQAEEATGVAWPKSTGTFTCGRADVLFIGPMDWLVIMGGTDAMPLLNALCSAFTGSTHRATNVSSALTRIQVEGVNARDLLSKGCSLDLHPQAFLPGQLARTRLAGMPVIVRCIQPSGFECIVSASYRDYLGSWLADAAAEY